MGTFKSLPNEVLEIILSYAGEHINKSQRMAVNRNWYNIYLSLVYTAPVIDLDSEPFEFYDITESPFHPGQYTTSITFRSFSAEPECTQSKLYRLMMHTPHVKEVKFDKIKKVKAQGWEYFYKVLKTANAWKLHCLPDDWKLKFLNGNTADRTLIYSTYLKCAQYLKHSINSLRLMKQMMPTNMDLSFLNVLTALQSLNITKGFLKSVYDLDLLLQHVPMLEELEVDFKKTSFISDHDNGEIILTREYPSIKKLSFYSFVFQTDQQACIFYTNFTGLKKLHIEGIQNELTLKPETAKKFFKMLLSLLDYNFGLRGTFIGRFDFINNNSPQETHASVYNHKKNTDAVDIQKSEDFPDGMINYYFTDDRAVATHVLPRLGPDIQLIKLNNVDDKNIQYYLEVIFSNKHKNLHTIVFYSLAFGQFSKADLLFTSGIQTIVFRFCKLSTYALKELSLNFTNLKIVNFEHSESHESFENWWKNIILPNTDIQQLSITCTTPYYYLLRYVPPGIRDPPILAFVSITLTDEGVTRYYYTRGERIPEIVETTEKHFNQIARRDLRGFIDITAIVIIHVKSIRELTLKLNNDSSSDIIMVFKPLKKLLTVF